ncbi:MAG: hypothetical protein NXI31_02950 [bacterium]|nr:hypothetical protein [bacterium]
MIADFAAPALDDADQLWLARLLYWAVPVVLAVWGLAATRRLVAARWSPAPFFRRHGLGLGVALAVTIATPLVLSPTMRMQFDETSLCGTAQNMHLNRTAMMGLAAVPAAGVPVSGERGTFDITDGKLDKRPTLWAFLVSVVHDISGYRVANAFAVNLALWFLLLAMVAVAVGARAGAILGATAPLALFSTPLLPAAATGAGFELLALVLLAAVALAALGLLERPGPTQVQWLVANALLYSWSRYESVAIAVGVVVLALALASRSRRRSASIDGALVGRSGGLMMVGAAALLVPLLLLLWHSRDRGFYLEAGEGELVALAHVGRNLGALLGAMFGAGLAHSFPGWLGGIGVLATLVWIVRRRCIAPATVVIVPVLAQTAVVLLWFYGDVTERTAERLYLPVAALVTLALLGVPLLERRARHVIAVGMVGLAVMRGIVMANGDAVPEHRTQQLLEQVDRVLAEVPHDPTRTVWVTTVAQYFVVHGRAALPPHAFDKREPMVGGAAVYVLETPLDPVLGGWFGQPTAVLGQHASTCLGRALDPGSDAEIVVHRLTR